MLRTFTAALIATALVAGSAFAAQPSSTTAAAPAAAPAAAASTQKAAKPADTAKQVKNVKPVKTVKHVRKPVRHHTAHQTVHAVKPGSAKTVKSSA